MGMFVHALWPGEGGEEGGRVLIGLWTGCCVYTCGEKKKRVAYVIYSLLSKATS